MGGLLSFVVNSSKIKEKRTEGKVYVRYSRLMLSLTSMFVTVKSKGSNRNFLLLRLLV